MSRHKKTYCLILLFSIFAAAQEKTETVFISGSQPDDKAPPEYVFGQFSIAIPLRGNPWRDDLQQQYAARGEQYKPTVLDFIFPDGLTVHGGYGVHLKSWVGVSANIGIDWLATQKLVSVPLYGAVTFNPQIWEETNIYLQAGYGRSFALGRGNLSGSYFKARLGLIRDNNTSLYLEISGNDFPLNKQNSVGSISLGVSAFNFNL